AIVAAIATVPAPAYAATIGVTTVDDVVNALDGVISLREAVTSANKAKGATTISLSAGEYELDACGRNEDANGTGDLDYTSTNALTIDGNGATVTQTCSDQRVLHLTT